MNPRLTLTFSDSLLIHDGLPHKNVVWRKHVSQWMQVKPTRTVLKIRESFLLSLIQCLLDIQAIERPSDGDPRPQSLDFFNNEHGSVTRTKLCQLLPYVGSLRISISSHSENI